MSKEIKDEKRGVGKLDTMVSQKSDTLLAKAMCVADGEEPYDGSERHNVWRWQDYLDGVPKFKHALLFYGG